MKKNETPEKTEIELLTDISFKLDKLMGILAIQGKDTLTQAKILRSLGLTLKETSILVGIPEGTLKSREHKTRMEKQGKTVKKSVEESSADNSFDLSSENSSAA